MPELPEVETTIRGLVTIKKCQIINIKVYTFKLRFLIPKNIKSIKKGTIIKNIKRRGKFILFYLNNDKLIVIHLGMSGRLRLISQKEFKKNKHDHFIIKTNHKKLLVFNDIRKFGFIDYNTKKIIENKKYLLSLGIEPFSKKLTLEYLFLKINKSEVPIKQILLNQKIITGIGNIYASEILFDARISPLIKGKNLDLKKIKKIIFSTRKILNKAIQAGGSTLQNYTAADGTLGNFQNNFKVYSKDGKKILGKKIKKIIQYGRSTYFCPDLQKINKN